jgi:D-alanine--poly(phosphoribitol) ligase subunit 1
MTHLIQEYFGESAQRFPNKPAVCCNEDSITYRDLDEFTNKFSRLINNYSKRGSFVPFFLPKSINSIKSILSILKADCAYIPVDVNSPAQRLESILFTAKASVLIVNSQTKLLFETLLPEHKIQLINIDEELALSNEPIDYRNISIDLAYVLFTSGSTGTPKGVMIPHKAIIDYIDWCVDTYHLTSDDVISNHAPLYFDNSTFDLYTAFKIGATLHLVHEELNAVIPLLVKWLSERKITTFFCVPSVLTLLLKSRRLKEDSFPHLRHLICAGEVLPAEVLSEWMKRYPHVQFTNMYGPTEITVDCSFHIVHQTPDEKSTSIPIGKARKNMELFVRTPAGELSKSIGSEGELLVRGTSVAYGYLGDSERTNKAFIQNPQHDFFHDTLYCTGDLVRIDEHNNFLFLGRSDDQIKFLGYRIELGEIEASIRVVSGVDECVVVFNNSANESEKELGALVSVTSSLSLDALRDALKLRLPSYMVPSRLILCKDEFPRTPNGKYDRKAVKGIIFRGV